MTKTGNLDFFIPVVSVTNFLTVSDFGIRVFSLRRKFRH